MLGSIQKLLGREWLSGYGSIGQDELIEVVDGLSAIQLAQREIPLPFCSPGLRDGSHQTSQDGHHRQGGEGYRHSIPPNKLFSPVSNRIGPGTDGLVAEMAT